MFLEPKKCFYAKPGFSEFHMSNVEKHFLEPDFFLQSRASLSFIRAVRKELFFRA